MGNSAYIKTATSKSTVTFVEISFLLLFDYKKKKKKKKPSNGGDCWKQYQNVILQAKERGCAEEWKTTDARGRKEKGSTVSTVRLMDGQKNEPFDDVTTKPWIGIRYRTWRPGFASAVTDARSSGRVQTSAVLRSSETPFLISYWSVCVFTLW